MGSRLEVPGAIRLRRTGARPIDYDPFLMALTIGQAGQNSEARIQESEFR